MSIETHAAASQVEASSDPQALAEQVAQAMFARDRASQMLGMAIDAVGPGYARLSMTVRDDMVNGHAICHGGLTLTLADSAFAFACNSDNHNTVGAACSMDYLRPAFAGDRLTAEARERHVSGRTGIFDVTVTNQNGDTIGLFRGKSQRVKGAVLDAMQAAQPQS